MHVLAIDIGGTNVKLLASGESEPRRFPSGPHLTPQAMVQGAVEATSDWRYDHVSIGYPGVIGNGRIATEPHNLGQGWVGFDFAAAFGKPARIINDAAMQALGSYRGGNMLFLGLGTGLGTALVYDGTVVPMEVGHMQYRKATFEDYVGVRGLERFGKKKWARHVQRVVRRMSAAFAPDDIVLGGGNAKKLAEMPPGCRAGDNANAFIGGFRLWDPTHGRDDQACRAEGNPDQ